MGAAAQLDGICVAGLEAAVRDAHGHDAHLVAVFLAEQRQRPLLDGRVGRHQMGLDRRVLQDHGVGQILDRADLVLAHGLGMGEVEAQAPRLHERALLGHMGAEDLAERLVQKMGRGMMRPGRAPAGVIDLEHDRIAEREIAGLQDAVVEEEAVQLLLGVLDGESGLARNGERAAVADLAAGLRVERRLIDDDDAAVARMERIDALAVLDQCR